jgi:hypothetical protein
MARGPTAAELPLLPPERQKHGEKVMVAELAAFLGCDSPVIHRFAHPMGGVRTSRDAAGVYTWLRPREAQRVMLAVRAWQGSRYAQGFDHHVLVEAAREADRAKRLREGRIKGGRTPKPLVPEKWTPPKPKNTCSHMAQRRSRGCRSTWFDPRNGHSYAEWEGNPLHTLPCAVWVVIEGPDGDGHDASGVLSARCAGLDHTSAGGEGGRLCL